MLWLTILNNLAHAQSMMPTAATKIAVEYDSLYSFLVIVSFVSSAILIGGMIYFAVKYKRKSNNDKTAYITHSTILEVIWSFVPLVIFLAVFAWGWKLYHEMRAMPANALEVQVYGKQWAWTMEYKNGVKATELVVPVNKPIKLVMTSEDVIHSFYVPSFRIKQDVIPGRYTALWFEADKLGEFHVFCTEFCGTSHSAMTTKVRVVTQAEFDKWLIEESEVGNLPLAQRGAKLFQVKACASCHNVDNPAAKVGPSLYQLFDHEVELDDGSKVMADENYIRESILISRAKIVKGFQPVMPAFQGQLNEVELNALIAYLKELK